MKMGVSRNYDFTLHVRMKSAVVIKCSRSIELVLERFSCSKVAESNSVPDEFPASGFPEVTVCNVVSPLVHVTVVPFETVRVSGTKNFPLLGTEDPGEIVTESPPDAPVALPVILPDVIVVALSCA